MATREENEDIRAMLERQANQRINPFMKGLSMLTGGIAGEFTGTNEDIRNRNYAKRALMEQNIRSLDEDRSIKRRLIENSLQQNIDLDPNSSVEEMVSKIRSESLKGDIIKGEGYLRGIGQSVGPSQYELDPRFKTSVLSGQSELAKQRATIGIQKDLQAASDVEFLKGSNVKLRGDETPGELSALAYRSRIEAQSAYPQAIRQAGEKDATIELFNQNPDLEAFKGYDSKSIQDLAPGVYKGLNARASKDFQKSVAERTKLTQENAVVEATSILNGPIESRDPKKLYQLSPYLPDYIIKSPKFQSATQTGPGPTSEELKGIKTYTESLADSNRVSNLIARVAATPGGLKKFSDNNFGYIANQLNTKGSKFFSSDDERELARALNAEYESFKQGPRKALFGASLTAGEESSSALSWGSPSDKDFLNRAIQYIDRLQDQDPLGFYIDAGKSINPQLIERVAGLKKNYQEIRPTIGIRPYASGVQSPVGSLRNQGTNAPAPKQKIVSITPL